MDYELPNDVAHVAMRGLASAVRSGGTLSETQRSMLTAVGKYLLGCDIPPDQLEPISPTELAAAIPEEGLRRRLVHGMVALEIVADPVPPEVVARVQEFAAALQVDDAMLVVARDYSKGAMDLARDDYVRNSYPMEYYTEHAGDSSLHQSPAPTGGVDPGLAARWQALEQCPAGSLGRTVWDFYQMRHFAYPGTEGAVDPLLAQHDWVHCLADYGTSAMGEIEVFSFIAGAIPDPRGFSYLVVIFGLFETGYVPMVPGVATADPGHLSAPGGPERFADAVRRGILTGVDVMGGIDWFAHADQPIDEARLQLGVPPKGEDAVRAGSLSAMDPDAVFKHAR